MRTNSGESVSQAVGVDPAAPGDGELVTRVLAGNRADYALLVERYQQLACTLARRILHNQEDAREVAQDAFVKAWQQLDRLANPAAFRPWLCSIVRHTALNRERAERRRGRGCTSSLEEETPAGHMLRQVADETTPSPDCQAGSQELQQHFEQAVRELDEPWRSTYILRELEGLSGEETAQVLQVASGTVKSRLFEARRRLARKLEHLLDTLS